MYGDILDEFNDDDSITKLLTNAKERFINSIKSADISQTEDVRGLLREKLIQSVSASASEPLNSEMDKLLSMTLSAVVNDFQQQANVIFQESQLLKAIEEAVPDVDLSKVYKKYNIEDFQQGVEQGNLDSVKSIIDINS